MSLVSIVIPTYNYGHLLGRTLDSCIAQQAHARIEIIVVDDGSTDNTAEVVRDYTARFPSQVRYFPQSNRGVSAARNAGLAEATGEYIAFMDADDCFTPDGLEVRLNAFRDHPDIGIVLTEKYSRYDNDDRQYYLPRVKRNMVADGLYRELLRKELPAAVTQALIRAPLARQSAFPEHLKTGEDTVYLAKLLFKAKACVLTKPTVIVHYHADSLRNEGEAAVIQRRGLVETLFDDPEYQGALAPLRPAYASEEYFFLFKLLYKAGRYREARPYYIRALRARPIANLLKLKPMLRFVRLNLALGLQGVLGRSRTASR